MASFSVAEAKNNLSRLIDRALAGEQVIITRHGKPVVALTVVPHATEPKRSIAETLDWLRTVRGQFPSLGTDSVTFLREMYEEFER